MTVTATADVGDYTGEVEAAIEGDDDDDRVQRPVPRRRAGQRRGRTGSRSSSTARCAGRLPAGRRRRVRARRDARPDDVLTDATDATPSPLTAADAAPILFGLVAPRPARLRRARRRVPAGPQLVWGPNAAGKTSLLEAIVLPPGAGRTGRPPTASSSAGARSWPASRRASAAGDGSRGSRRRVEVALVRTASGGARKRIRVNGVARRAAALVGVLRTVHVRARGDAPRRRLAVAPSRGARPPREPAVAGLPPHLSTYGRALQQRNGLLRLIREEQATRGELRFWDATLLEAGTAVREERHRLLDALAGPLAAAHAEIAPDEAAADASSVGYATKPRSTRASRSATPSRWL